ncbi:hypothetical protein RJ641_035746 [Dillenia turbinata]|uniref:Uncharacterized protein n=1 Tax=Dillenia turbinata TaxID=194707 RepID=A0AAN8VTM9_9MAGN
MNSAAIKTHLTSTPKNPKPLVLQGLHITCNVSFLFGRASTASSCRALVVKCNGNLSEPSENGGLKDALLGMVDRRVEELLNKEENRTLFAELEKATQRVEIAKRELAEFERREIEAKQMRDYIIQLETRASEIAESQKEIAEARAMVEEAERVLSAKIDALETGTESTEIDREEERLESAKAAVVSAMVGTVAGLPISLTRLSTTSQLILPLAITFISCALFGVTFRYAIRRDLDNIQLKTGTSAAFAFVKGLGTLAGGPPLEVEVGSFLVHALDGAVYVSENLFIFVSAAVALDFCFKMRLLSPFPMQKSV